jgi:dienelactone hydrolase
VATICLCAFGLFGCDHRTFEQDHESLHNSKFETYSFPTRNVSGFKELISGKSVTNAEGFGALYLPMEATETNKVPLMVILHGSGGTWGGRGARHAELLTQNGIAALVIDSFANRGLSSKEKYIQRLMEVNFPDQLTDAFGALNSLQNHPLIDGSRIGIMGYSMGGTSAILAAYENIASACSKNKMRFVLHVAFYAPCIIQPKVHKTTGFPVVGLWGKEDECTLKSRCDEIFRVFEAEGGFVQSRWYEGAAHGWNGTKPVQYYEDIPNFAPCKFVIQENGQVIELKTDYMSDTDKQMIANSEYCVDFGYSIGHNERTDELANLLLLQAISQHM